MQQVVIFSEPTPVFRAFAEVCSVLGFVVSRIDVDQLVKPEKYAGTKLTNASLAVAIPSKSSASLPLITAHAVRLRCSPFQYSGPIAVIEPLTEKERIPVAFIEAVGIHTLSIQHTVSRLFALVLDRRKWKTYPSIDCRPVWALEAEAKFLAHRTRNVFGWIDDGKHEYAKLWKRDAELIFLPDQR